MIEPKNIKVLITAGATTIPIDRVRAITNIFKGRTGANIAEYFDGKGYQVTLLTSNPSLFPQEDSSLITIMYKTYDDLLRIMKEEICNGGYDIIIHSAAVSDYKVEEVCIPGANEFSIIPLENTGKVSSSYPELYLRLTQTQKIVDLIRTEWKFEGFLAKFKLEVGISDDELIKIATKSMKSSDADIIIANCLEWAKERAYAITWDDIKSISRNEIAKTIEECYECYIGNNR